MATLDRRSELKQRVGVTYDSLDRRLEGRVAVVTGAAQGIGKAIAYRLGWEAAKLVIMDLETQAGKLRDLAGELEKAGVDTVVVTGDASTLDTVTRTCDAALSRFGKVDILVNNVGGGILNTFLEKTEEMWRTEIERNLVPTIRFCQALVPHMVERRYGRIVNIGAESVRNGLWEHSTYNAAKGGVHGMSSTLARELAPYTITVNTVAPCIVSTERVRPLIEQGAERARKYISLIPMARAATPEEVAACVAFLSSDDATFITGQVVSVNGGSSML